MSVEETLKHHLEAFGDGDVDAILSDYRPDSVICTSDGVLRGLEDIRRLFEAMLSDLLPPGSNFEMKQQVVEGELAYIVWTASSETVEIPMGTDTFLIRDDKIVTQTFGALIIPKS